MPQGVPCRQVSTVWGLWTDLLLILHSTHCEIAAISLGALLSSLAVVGARYWAVSIPLGVPAACLLARVYIGAGGPVVA
jgi:hypothetical protein